ncbi:EF-Hand 1, calcium-binding site domain-containing protein [Paramicrosporidium saccamoebae]|uniref:EF-Hand 1, calcium-binding site domain-containing protein n=1 Tax=Paramicrosporidium saccamoebae TaxID=1246581 RepID=A0A2H9TNI5_9FUNG|nr:EF-Hand 1, calcium-binding site domain-containing protein [Paramicrosporidium saccamoebae]
MSRLDGAWGVMSEGTPVVVQVEEEKQAIRADYGELNRRGFYATTSEFSAKRKQTFLEFIPLWIRYTFVAVVGTFVLGLPALVICMTKESDQFWPVDITSRFEYGVGESFRWSLIVCTVYGAYYMTLALICLLPLCLRLVNDPSDDNTSAMRVRDNFKQLIIIRHFIAFPAASLALWLMVSLFFNSTTTDSSLTLVGNDFYMTRLSFALFVFASLLMIAKLALNEITINYHYEYYAERLTKNMFGMAAIRRLSKEFPPGKRPSGAIAKSAEDMERDEATYVAIAIFDGLRCPGKDILSLADFEEILEKDDAKRIFEEFDVNSNGDVTQREITDGVQRIYSERDNLNQALSANDEIVSRLGSLALLLVVAVTASLCLPIFDVSLSNTVFALFGYAMTAHFLFSDSLTAIFATVIFIFVSHPFDAGDVVTLNEKTYKVKHIGWWQSSFYGEGSALVYHANHSLATMSISNFRRSGAMYETFRVNIQQTTPKVQILQLEKRLYHFVEKNPRDYSYMYTLSLDEIVNSQDLRISFSVLHRSNFQNSPLRAERSNKLHIHLCSVIQELGIKLALD